MKESACQCRRCKTCQFDPWFGKIPWRRKCQPTPVFLPGTSHGQRSLAGFSPWGRKEWDTIEHACLPSGSRELPAVFSFLYQMPTIHRPPFWAQLQKLFSEFSDYFFRFSVDSPVPPSFTTITGSLVFYAFNSYTFFSVNFFVFVRFLDRN